MSFWKKALKKFKKQKKTQENLTEDKYFNILSKKLNKFNKDTSLSDKKDKR